MLRSRRGSRRNVDTAELNITAFMNLMVILVPFLLITAVFSRLAILELNLPGSSTEPAKPSVTAISAPSASIPKRLQATTTKH
jgi:biopolymer transport protein ExbD